MGEQRTGGLVVGRDEVLLVDAGMLKPVIGCTIVAVFFFFLFFFLFSFHQDWVHVVSLMLYSFYHR